MTYTDAELEKKFPLIPWRKPVPVIFADGREAFCCRFCIAQKGLPPDRVPLDSETIQDAARHIEREHPKKQTQQPR